MRLWDLETGRELRKFEGHTGGVISVAFGPDGCTVLSSSEDKTVRLWNVVSGRELRRMNGHTDFVTSVIFSPDGLTALSGSGDNTLRLWNLNSGREVRRIEGHTTHAPSQNNSKIQNPPETAVEVHLAFSPDGRTVISGSDDNSVRLWDIETGRELRQFKGHTSYVRSVAFSPDGHSILSGGSDKTIRLWDVDSGRELRQFTGHEKTVRSVAFSPNGKSVLSGSMDNTLALWNFDYPVRQREWMPRAEAAKKALADHPDDAAALGVLGDWYAFLGLDQQAIDLLERARAGGVAVSPLTLGRCYWEFGDLPHAQREYTTALAATQDAQEKFYLQLCLSAIQAATTQSATPTTKPE
jgi:WD40 repeat protein